MLISAGAEGKTTFIGTGGQQFKILIVRPPVDHVDPIIGSGCQEMVVRSWEEIFEALEYVQHAGHEWDWVWLDSISLLQDVGLDDVYEGVLDRRGPKGSLARKEREAFGPDRGEYRVNFWRLAQWVRHTVGAGTVNLGITAHAFYWEPNDNDVTPARMWPWVQGKMMPAKIAGMMNIVGYGEIRSREHRGKTREVRVLHTSATENYYAKCQIKLPDGSPIFNGEIVSPTLPAMMEALGRGRTTTRRRRRER
jgi:hypothetical protein